MGNLGRKKKIPPSVKQEFGDVQGHDTQDGSDVIISQPASDKRKNRLKRIATILAIVLAIPGSYLAYLNIREKNKENLVPETAQYYGVVRFEDGTPVPNATIRIESSSQSGEVLGIGQTKSNGQFNFIVKANPEAAVWVTITKDGIVGFAEMQVLAGNKSLTFKRGP